MSTTIAVHSFRRGTGRSFLSANLAVLYAVAGHRTALIDLDLSAPATQTLFHLSQADIAHTINDYLLGHCKIEDAAVDMTRRLQVPGEGRLFVIPSSSRPVQIAKMMREEYDARRLNDAFAALVAALHLDVLIVDTRPGISDDTLLLFTSASAVAVIMRPDRRDYQGTGVTLDLVRQIGVPRFALIVNQVSPSFDPAHVAAEAERSYGCEVTAVLPFSPQLMADASSGIFVLHHPEDPLTVQLWELMRRLTEDDAGERDIWGLGRAL